MSNDEIKSIWDKSDKTPLTEHTITDFSKFMQEMKKPENAAMLWIMKNMNWGVRCIAASIKHGEQKPQYAFSISAPIHRMDEKRMKEIAEYALAMKKINL